MVRSLRKGPQTPGAGINAIFLVLMPWSYFVFSINVGKPDSETRSTGVPASIDHKSTQSPKVLITIKFPPHAPECFVNECYIALAVGLTHWTRPVSLTAQDTMPVKLIARLRIAYTTSRTSESMKRCRFFRWQFSDDRLQESIPLELMTYLKRFSESRQTVNVRFGSSMNAEASGPSRQQTT